MEEKVENIELTNRQNTEQDAEDYESLEQNPDISQLGGHPMVYHTREEEKAKLCKNPQKWGEEQVEYVKSGFQNFTDPNYVSPGGVFQGPREGKCFKYQLTVMQQIFLGTFLCFFIFYLFVINMEHKCDKETADYCMEYILNNMKVWFFEGEFIVLMSFLTFYLSYKRIIPRYFMIQLGLMLIYMLFMHFPMDLQKTTVFFYGPAQAIFTIVLFVLTSICLGCGTGIRYLWRKFRIAIYAVLIGILVLVIMFFSAQSTSCDGWEKGLTGEIDFGGNYCKILRPDTCYPVIFDNWFNMGPESCEVQHDQKKDREFKRQVLSKYHILQEGNQSQQEKEDILNDPTFNYLGWPHTNYMNQKERIFDVIQDNVIEQSVPYATLEEAFQHSEIVIGTESYSMNIKVQRNETLVEQRKKEQELKEHKANSIADNVIVVYIDTVSRAQAHRKLPKSMKFLRKFNGIKEEFPEEQEKQIFEFYRFHSLDKLTKNNALILHFDEMYEDYLADPNKYEEKYSENPKFNLMKHYKEAGFIVGHAANTCTSSCLFRTQYQDMRNLFLEEPGDHEMTMWDPNYINPYNYYDLQQGPNSFKRRCLYGDDSASYVFEYGQQFLRAYEQEKKFLYMEFTDSHELTSEVVQYMDDDLLNFLETAENDGIFDKETAVILVSDHGQHIIQTFYIVEKPVHDDDWDKAAKDKGKKYSNNVYQVERMLPLYQMMFSKDIFEKYGDLEGTLKKNEQVVFGFREVRRTLLALAYGLDDPRFQGNVLQELQEDADCRDLGMRPILHHEQFCICRPDFS